MDMKKLEKKALAGKNVEALRALTSSETGEKLVSQIDGAVLEKAVREGDMETLSNTLKTVIGTPEGRLFMEQVRKAADGHGR